MNEFLPIFISIIFVTTVVIILSRKLKLSSRYDRKPRELNSWRALDQGLDPTEDKEA